MLDTEELRGKTLPGWSRPTGGPRNFLAFECPGPAVVDAKYAELTAAGYRVSTSRGMRSGRSATTPSPIPRTMASTWLPGRPID
jgi:hypothetical protein